jgi:hypothetical protein
VSHGKFCKGWGRSCHSFQKKSPGPGETRSYVRKSEEKLFLGGAGISRRRPQVVTE